MSKIFIFTDDPEAEAVKNAIKLLSTANTGYTVTAEKLVPANILSIALGLLTANNTGALPPEPMADDPEVTADADDAADADADDAPAVTDDAADDTTTNLDSEIADAISGDTADTATTGDGTDDLSDFKFESLGRINVDGELIDAYKTNGDPQLFVNRSVDSRRCSYNLNESIFAIWLNNVDSIPTARVRLNKSTAVDVKVMESKTGTPYILLNPNDAIITTALNATIRS